MRRIPQIWPGWQADDLIGRGAYGKVYRASNASGEQAAIKIIEIPRDETEIAELQRMGMDALSARMYFEDTATRSTMSFAGSRPYMAPEVEGGHYDASVDTYSLGLMLYRWLNGGRPPFLPATGSVTQQQIQRADLDRPTFKEPPLPAGEGTDPALAGIVLRAIAPHAQDRWESAEAFGEALQAWLDGELEDVRDEIDGEDAPSPQPNEDEVTIPLVTEVPDEPEPVVEPTERRVTPAASDTTSDEWSAGAAAKPPFSLPVPPHLLAVAAVAIVALVVLALSLPSGTSVTSSPSNESSSSSTSEKKSSESTSTKSEPEP